MNLAATDVHLQFRLGKGCAKSYTADMKAYTLEVRVRFAETDAMGVVYHARYFEYMEAARIALMEAEGLPYKKLVEEGFHLPLVEARIKYRASAKFDDILQIEATMEPLDGVKLNIRYRILRGQSLIAEAQTTHAFIDLQGHPVRPPKIFTEAFA